MESLLHSVLKNNVATFEHVTGSLEEEWDPKVSAVLGILWSQNLASQATRTTAQEWFKQKFDGPSIPPMHTPESVAKHCASAVDDLMIMSNSIRTQVIVDKHQRKLNGKLCKLDTLQQVLDAVSEHHQTLNARLSKQETIQSFLELAVCEHDTAASEIAELYDIDEAKAMQHVSAIYESTADALNALEQENVIIDAKGMEVEEFIEYANNATATFFQLMDSFTSLYQEFNR